MSSAFIGEDFLLHSETARQLFHDYAKDLPVIDYHNHLDPRVLADDKQFDNLSDLWVVNDPYKHRAMRIAGVPERQITGDASPKEKYLSWAATCPKTLGNPLYHWTALELKRIFGFDKLLSADTADEVYEHCNHLLQTEGFSALGILSKYKAKVLCTSDDLLDDVSIHQRASVNDYQIKVVPSLRGDSILAFGTASFKTWLQRLGGEHPIQSLGDYLEAVDQRLNVFHAAGCRVADHALDNGYSYCFVGKEEAGRIFTSCLTDDCASASDIVKLKSFVLHHLGVEYAHHGWAMLLHVGAERWTSSRLRRLCGPAGGYASIGSCCDIRSLSNLINDLENINSMPKTIIFTLNPADNAAFATLTGSFTGDGVAGKLQFGPAWWYNDHHYGIEGHFDALASYSLFSQFVGMTTDSRSILSFSRHEYFRRILCDYIGQKVTQGHYPNDIKLLGQLVADISYNNINRWLNFN